MANVDNLRSHGWHITEEGFNHLTDNGSIVDLRSVTRKALDVDIRDFGASIVATELNKSTFGPVNLQIVKIRNISAPKSKPNSQGAPRMLKLILTDGHTNCQGIEVTHLPSLSLDKTIPGTKLFINGAPMVSGSILLAPDNCKVLGGSVTALVEKWELSKLMPSHIRHNEDGPPAWVNFGKKIINTLDNRGFKSLENKNKDNSKENAEFQNQRQDAILEATQGAVKKVFGGGVKPAQTFNSQDSYHNNRENYPQRTARPLKGKKDRGEPEKMEKPSQRVSLFDFLEDKLSLTDTNQTKSAATTAKVFNNDVPPPKPKPEYFDNKNKINSSSHKQPNKYDNKFKPQNSYPTTSNNNTLREYDRPKSYQTENRFQSDKPKPHQSESRSQSDKPRTLQSENRFQNDKPKTQQPENRFQIDKSKPYQPESRFQSDKSKPYQPDSRFLSDKSKPYQPDSRVQSDKSKLYQPDSRFQSDKSKPYQPDSRFQSDKSKPYQPESRFPSDKLKLYQPENRFQTDRPPRFQRQRQDGGKFGNASDSRSKPNTNVFVDKLTNEINNISLYNSRYDEKLKQTPMAPENWKWNIGDRCMAKYWEDDKFYNAVVTGITTKTIMVEFVEYGNFEEVLLCDCIPITPENEDRKRSNRYNTDNQDITDSIEYRRGKARPYLKNSNKQAGQSRGYES